MDFKYFIREYLYVFVIWWYVLIGVGVFVVCEFNKVKSVIVIVVYILIIFIMLIVLMFI